MNKEIAIKNTFSRKLKELREESSLSQTELANELGVSRGSISYYENSDRMAGIDFLYKVAEYFNCSTDYLLGLTQIKDIELLSEYRLIASTNDKQFCEENTFRSLIEDLEIIRNIDNNLNNSQVGSLSLLSTVVNNARYVSTKYLELMKKISRSETVDINTILNLFVEISFCRDGSNSTIDTLYDVCIEMISEKYFNMCTDIDKDTLAGIFKISTKFAGRWIMDTSAARTYLENIIKK